MNEDFEQIIVEFVDLNRVEYYDYKSPSREATGYIKISLADEWDPEGFVKFEVDLPNIVLLVEQGEKKGIEVIAIWESLIESNGTFYSDSNGVELLERKWIEGYDGMDIPANYYPVTAMIGVRDENTAMFVLNDRAQGGSSIKPGRVELAINRKTVGAD